MTLKYGSTDVRFLVAIDFGTTFSGIFCIGKKPDEELDDLEEQCRIFKLHLSDYKGIITLVTRPNKVTNKPL
ncbi:7112_t:CDS:2 [Funneliformis mosseae]|uniref:7112_t:CDS:1 n=1 Tax=Funneliformis mosseae TaxID=27381 RepID=A0A9N8VIC5_FUNMO|nr:7112_t:CDS:2 [Funneliformis mosseae]